MSAEKSVEKHTGDESPGETPALARRHDELEKLNDEQLLRLPPASARDMPRPATGLSAAPRKEIGQLSVSLVGDLDRAPDLDEVEKANRSAEQESRLPLTTVIEAIVARHGGSVKLGELAGMVEKYWNRSLPFSPYTREEFIYVMLQNSDTLRIT